MTSLERAREWLQRCAMADFIEHEMGPSDHPDGARWNDTDSASLAALLDAHAAEARERALDHVVPHRCDCGFDEARQAIKESGR